MVGGVRDWRPALCGTILIIGLNDVTDADGV